MMPLSLSAYTAVSALGQGREATIEALRAGRSGLSPCTFESVDLPTWAGEVQGMDDVQLPSHLAAFDCRNNRLAWLGLQQDGFWQSATAALRKYRPARIGVFLGTSTSGILESEIAYRSRDPATGFISPPGYETKQNTFSIAAFVRRALGLHGPASVVSSACASTAKAFAIAARHIDAGLCDAAIVGGADTLCLTTLYGFHSLMLTAPGPCRPFAADRQGISIGEAAAFALLVPTADAPEAIRLLGYGESSDAHHMSTPHPQGRGAREAMQLALDMARLPPDAIGYVNMHGTATGVGDAAEDQAVVSLFGGQVPCSSTKSYTGHTLGAAGILEAVIAALCLERGFIPANIPTEGYDPAFGANYVTRTLEQKLSYVLSNSFGFGGSNCSLVLGRP